MVSLISIKNMINRGEVTEALLELVYYIEENESVSNLDDLDSRVDIIEERLDNI